VRGDGAVAWDVDGGVDSRFPSRVCDLWVRDEACDGLSTAFTPVWLSRG
jgi:hypothetical protein